MSPRQQEFSRCNDDENRVYPSIAIHLLRRIRTDAFTTRAIDDARAALARAAS